MATRDQVLGMFGASPEAIMARIRRERAQEVLKTQDPFQRAGGAIGLGLARMFGGEPEEVTRQRRLQETLQGVDMTNPDQMTQAAGLLNQAGFSNEAMQLLSRADQFRTSAQQRATSEAQADAATATAESTRAQTRRGLYERVDETISQAVEIEGKIYYVPVKAKVKYNKETGDREVLTSSDELLKMAQQSAQKMKREDLAAQSEETLRKAQLTAAQKQATLAEKQLTEEQRKAGMTTGLARVPIDRVETDALTQRPKRITGWEYKSVTGKMVNGVFTPNMEQLPEGAEVVDDDGIPQNATKVDRSKDIIITTRGQLFKQVGSGENAQFFQVSKVGDIEYTLPNPVDPGTLYKAQQEDQKPSTSVEPRPTAPGNTKAKADWDRQYGRTHYPDGTIKPNQEGFEDAAG